jgi:hypothetical protein
MSYELLVLVTKEYITNVPANTVIFMEYPKNVTLCHQLADLLIQFLFSYICRLLIFPHSRLWSMLYNEVYADEIFER